MCIHVCCGYAENQTECTAKTISTLHIQRLQKAIGLVYIIELVELANLTSFDKDSDCDESSFKVV